MLGHLKNTNKISPSTSGKSVNLPGRQVYIGLSGGVDSAVSAGLLKEQGYEVTGVFIKAWQPEWMKCTWREERRDAMKVCLALNIPFLFIDAENEYKQGVIDKMLEEYKAGRTPNPDVLCNREIKFGLFWQEAKRRGADFIATGHYWSGEKDQSYFLWTLTPEDLSHSLFPVGHMDKSEVRKLAKKYGLPVAEKKDSQGICFLGDISMEEFLSHYIEVKPGRVLNTKGEEIGSHKGLMYYTIGERHGFEVRRKGAESGPFYIVGKNFEANTLTVSDDVREIKELSPKKVVVKNLNWQQKPQGEVLAQIRYRGEKLPVEISNNEVTFAEPVRGLSLGQSIVFYSPRRSNAKVGEADQMIGGAVMDKIVS